MSQTPQSPREGLLDGQRDADESTIVLIGDGPDPGRYPPGTFAKILSGMATLAAMIAATYIVPALSWARPWTPEDPVLFWNLIGREFMSDEGAPELATQQAEVAVALAEDDEQREAEAIEDRVVVTAPLTDVGGGLPPYEPHPDDELAVPRSLELPEPIALDPFYRQLRQTDLGYDGAVTRVVHWGDSAIGNDHVSSALRELMQRRFGDAGHGFHLLARPNTSYRHRGVRFDDGGAWSHCYIILGCKSDGLYGLGGTTVWSSGGARSVFRTEDKLAIGRKLSRVELWYRAQPRGGNVRITVDDDEPTIVQTQADTPDDRWALVEVDDGPHKVEVRAHGGGRVRLYGVVLERDTPGVVWDGMEQLGAFANRMLNFDAEHLRGQIDHRDPALLVFQFGGNDLQIPQAQLQRFKHQFKAVLERFRGQDEPRPCLVISPVDHGQRQRGRVVSIAMMEPLTQAQRDVALEVGCAFFDTRAAMGGEGSASTWRRADPPLLSGDLRHLSHAGQKALGRMIYLALMEGYRSFREREG